eukprot:1587451-Lingulodinium_polyedra.AAC.1
MIGRAYCATSCGFLAEMGADDARDLQTKVLIKIVYDVCHVEDARGLNPTKERGQVVKSMFDFVQEVGKREFLDATLKEEFASLR